MRPTLSRGYSVGKPSPVMLRGARKELGLTTMDYTKVHCPETEAIIKTCMNFRVNEAMDDDYIRAVAKAVRKVAKYYAA